MLQGTRMEWGRVGREPKVDAWAMSEVFFLKIFCRTVFCFKKKKKIERKVQRFAINPPSHTCIACSIISFAHLRVP